jgi:hypothetical protein
LKHRERRQFGAQLRRQAARGEFDAGEERTLPVVRVAGVEIG